MKVLCVSFSLCLIIGCADGGGKKKRGSSPPAKNPPQQAQVQNNSGNAMQQPNNGNNMLGSLPQQRPQPVAQNATNPIMAILSNLLGGNGANSAQLNGLLQQFLGGNANLNQLQGSGINIQQLQQFLPMLQNGGLNSLLGGQMPMGQASNTATNTNSASLALTQRPSIILGCRGEVGDPSGLITFALQDSETNDIVSYSTYAIGCQDFSVQLEGIPEGDFHLYSGYRDAFSGENYQFMTSVTIKHNHISGGDIQF